MDDDGDMAEMYLTEKKQRSEAYSVSDHYIQTDDSGVARSGSKSAPVSPVASLSGRHKLQRAFSSIISPSKHGSFLSSSSIGENIDQLEMLLEAYFVVIDNTLSKLLSVFIQMNTSSNNLASSPSSVCFTIIFHHFYDFLGIVIKFAKE